LPDLAPSQPKKANQKELVYKPKTKPVSEMPAEATKEAAPKIEELKQVETKAVKP
jgi:hypothetical protein